MLFHPFFYVADRTDFQITIATGSNNALELVGIYPII